MGLAVENLVIIGSGPAGYTAAIYAGRAHLKPVMLTGYQLGGVPGGQLMTTTEVENFPGFPQGITGPQLMERMQVQALRWGTELYSEDAIAVDFSQGPFTIRTEERQLKSHAVIIATGATAKRLNLPHEAEFWNQGISACAICDGASPIFKGVDLVVVGGGDTAAEEAIYLTRYGAQVHLLVRREQLRASQVMQQRLLANPKITIHWNTQALDVYGHKTLKGVRVKNIQTGIEDKIPARGLFYAIGHAPNTQIFQGQLELDAMGYIVTQPGRIETSVAGIYAVGDVQDHEFRQAITAAGSGCMGAMVAERWLSLHGLMQPVPLASQEPGSDPQPLTSGQATQLSQTSNFREQSSEVNPTANPKANPEVEVDLTSTHHAGGYALRKLYHKSDRLILVKYAAPSCGPCYSLKPILEKVVNEFVGKIHYVEIDIEQDPDIAQSAGVTGTPTIQFFKHKDLVKQLKGVKPKSQYRKIIQTYL